MQHLPPEKQERILDKNIEEFGKEFKKFEHKVRPKLLTHPNPWVAEQGDLPFQLFAINEGNALCNKFTFMRVSNATPGSRVELENRNFFFFDFKDSVQHYAEIHMAAGFSAVDRTMYLKRVNNINLLDIALLYHELVHVGQDNTERAHVHTEEDYAEYLAFKQVHVGRKPRLRIATEITAYALEIEVLNIALGGAIRNAVIQRRNPESVLKKLISPRKNQYGVLSVIAEFSDTYFRCHTIEEFGPVVHKKYSHVFDCI